MIFFCLCSKRVTRIAPNSLRITWGKVVLCGWRLDDHMRHQLVTSYGLGVQVWRRLTTHDALIVEHQARAKRAVETRADHHEDDEHPRDVGQVVRRRIQRMVAPVEYRSRAFGVEAAPHAVRTHWAAQIVAAADPRVAVGCNFARLARRATFGARVVRGNRDARNREHDCLHGEEKCECKFVLRVV